MIGRLCSFRITDPNLERAFGEVDSGGFDRLDFSPETLRLGSEVDHQLGAHDAVGETGVVLNIGGEHELPTGLVAGAAGFALEQ